MNNFKTIINAALKFLEKRISLASSQVVKAIESSDNAQVRSFDKLSAHFVAATKRMEKPTFDVNVDLEPLRDELQMIAAQVERLAQKKGPELASTEALLKMILSAINANAPEKIGAKIDAMDAVFKNLKPKDSVKFDDKQMQGLMAALTGGRGNGMSVGGDVLAARQVGLANVTMTAANTEYSYTFPANTVGFELRLRADDVPLLVAYTTGKLPTSGDGSAYLTVPAYFIEKTAGLDWSGKTIYFQAATASQTLEVITYTA